MADGGRTIRVAVLGTGQMGSGIAALLLEKPALELVGAFGRRRERAGRDLGLALGRAEPIGVAIESDLVRLLERARPDVAIQATCSRLAEAEPEIAACLERGIHVISIAEEMAWPAAASPERAARLAALARARGAVAVGTGVNPGFVLDSLVVTLTSVCGHVDSIHARRVNDLAPYGPTVLRSQGVGLSPEAFAAAVEAGTVVGHVGFPQSLAMIAAGLGWQLEGVEETRRPIVSSVPRETPFVRVEPGRTAGCLHTAVGFVEGRAAITLEHPQQIRPEAEGVATGDEIEIRGRPPVRLAGSPEIPGGQATAALAVNLVPRVLEASPGLKAMTDLPVPAAIMGPSTVTERRSDHAQGPQRLVPRGTWVELQREVLAPGERAPQVPEETGAVPLELRVKGFLVADSALGEEAEVRTPAGRRLSGTLDRALPAYEHGFGPPVPELLEVGAELRALLREGRDE